MTNAPTVQVNNHHAQIGMQVVVERAFFGGKEPAQPEREALRGQVSQRFAEAVERGELGLDASMEIGAALERLLGPRGKWLETPGCRLASVEVEDGDREDLRLPLELLRPPTGAEPVLVRCALASTETAPEGPRSYPEGGRIVLATADAGGPVPDDALRHTVHEVCHTGLHLASGSGDDRKRGAFEPAFDYLPHVSRAALQKALGPRDGRPGAAVLELVCHVREQGLCLHDDSGQEVVVGAEALAAVLAPFVSHLRVVVLVPVAERPQGDPGRTLVDVALALHRRGLAAVVAPRVPLPVEASPGLTAALFGALLGDAKVAPASLELALVHANGYLSTKDRLAHLGLRLWARAADGHDTRPLVIRPYRGLLSFEPEHKRFYMGRTAETTQVVERLAQLHAEGQPRLVLLVGASGVGKSSLAKAGVVPALVVKQGWAVILTRPAQHSGEELEALVEAEAQVGKRRLVVVVDQLEEVLTETDSHHEASKYLQRLWSLAAKEGVAVVATLRIDALDRGAEVRVDAEGRRTLEQLVPGPHAVFVHHLDGDALREVIAEPARCVGLELDPGLVDRLCNEALAEPGALPMLELVLDELWSRREGRTIVAAEFKGGLARRLADYADKCVTKLPEAQREQAQRILVRIATGPVVELATWRRRTTVEALRPFREERRAAFDAALAALVEARLVVRGDLRHVGSKAGDGSEDVAQAVESVELAHELLLRQWDALRGWIEGAAKPLAAVRDLERWVADHRKHESTLLTLEQLVYIEQADLPTDGDDLNGAMVELIEVSRRAVRKRKRLRRVLIVGVGVVALAFAGLSWWALGQRDAALEQKQVADEKTLIADEKTLIADEKTLIADEKTDLAQERLAQANELANELIYNTLPKLERYPEARTVSKEILEKLQQMLTKLGITDADTEAQWNIAVAHFRRGDEALHSDDIDVARREYQAAHDIVAKRAESFPFSPESQHDLSMSLYKLGIVEVQAGNLAAARDLFQRSLQVAEGLAKTDPHSVRAQHDLSLSLDHLGTVEVQAGNLAAAHDLFQRTLDIAEGLAKADPHSAQAQRELSVALANLGIVEVQAGNLAAARDLFQRDLDIAEELAKVDPHSAQAQRDLSVSLNQLGDVEVQAGNLATARDLFQRCTDILEGLAKADPHSAQAQRELSLSLHQLGKVEVQAGNLAVARDRSQRSLQLTEGLAKADPHSAMAQRDLSLVLNLLGDVEVQAGNLAAARDLFQRSLQVTEGLAKADPHSAQAQRDLSLSLNQLGDVEVQAGNFAEARDLFQRSLQIAEGLANADPRRAMASFDVVLSLLSLAGLAGKEGDIDALRNVVTAANERLDAMDAKGQITGYQYRETVRGFFRRAAEDLASVQ